MKKIINFAICLIMMAIAVVNTSCTHNATIQQHEWETIVTTETQQWVKRGSFTPPSGEIRNLRISKRASGVKTVSSGGYVTESSTRTKTETKTYNVWGYRTCPYCGTKHRSDRSCTCGNKELNSPFEISDDVVASNDEKTKEGHFCSYCGTFTAGTKCSSCGHSFDKTDKPYSSKFNNGKKVGNKTYSDLGNGQFKVTETNVRTYTDEDVSYIPPVIESEYSDYYEWEELLWRTNRTFPASGVGTSVEFKEIQLQEGERMGHSSEKYTIVYKVDDGNTITRTYNESEWRRLKDGQKVKVRKFGTCYVVSQETAH